MSAVQELIALTQTFSDFSYPVSSNKKIVKMAKGLETESIGLLKLENIAIAYTPYVKAGSEYKKHCHKEWEALLIYKGVMQLILIHENGQEIEQVLKPTDIGIIPSGIEHYAEFPVDTGFVAITIPADRGFPDANNC